MEHFKRAVVLLIVMVPFVLTLAGEATTYEWVDDGGVVHFTDNSDNIPAKFRKRVKELDSGRSGEVKAPAAPAQESTTSSQEGSAGGGHGVRYWQSSYSSLRAEIKSLEDGLASKREKLNQLRRKRIIYGRTSDRVAYNDMDQEISRDETVLKGLQEKLKALDAEADNAAVPREWRQ